MLLAEHIFASESCTTKHLTLLSDMRQHTKELDIESPDELSDRIAKRACCLTSRPHLDGVEVSVLGVDGIGKSGAYWNGVKEFWTTYFRMSDAQLRAYSPLRSEVSSH